METAQGATQEDGRGARKMNRWEVLGHLYVKTDIHHCLNGLKDRIKRMPGMTPYAIAWVVNGYLDAVLERKDYLRAYAIMQDNWVGYEIEKKEEKERTALEGIVSKHYSEEERRVVEAGVPSHFDRILEIIRELIAKGHPHLLDLAKIAEQENPEIALKIYDAKDDAICSTKQEAKIASEGRERVAMTLVETNHELAFQHLLGSANRAACIERLLDKPQPTSKEYEIAFWAMGKNCYETEAQMLEMYNRMAENAIATNPNVSVAAAWMINALLYDHKGRLTPQTKEQLKIAKERDELEPNLKYHYTPFGHDHSGFVTLAMKMWKVAQEKNDRATHVSALKAFRLADYEGPEKDRCMLFLLQEGDWVKDREVMATNDEEIAAGIHFIHPLPMRAYELLARHKDNEQAKKALGTLSERLDDLYMDKAYCAEMWAAEPRAERLDRLTKELIAAERITPVPNPALFHLFESMKDTGAMMSWYIEHGAKLYISEKYLAASMICRQIEDDTLLQQVKQELIEYSPAVARCDFEQNHDDVGMEMLRAHVLNQVHTEDWESRQYHEELVLKFLGIDRKPEEN